MELKECGYSNVAETDFLFFIYFILFIDFSPN